MLAQGLKYQFNRHMLQILTLNPLIEPSSLNLLQSEPSVHRLAQTFTFKSQICYNHQ